jgi:hypothetical protein
MIFLINALITFALSASTVFVEGTITAYDASTLTLQQQNGAIVKVPRTSYKKNKGIIVGKEVVAVQVRPSEWIRLNPQLLNKKESIKKDR